MRGYLLAFPSLFLLLLLLPFTGSWILGAKTKGRGGWCATLRGLLFAIWELVARPRTLPLRQAVNMKKNLYQRVRNAPCENGVSIRVFIKILMIFWFCWRVLIILPYKKNSSTLVNISWLEVAAYPYRLFWKGYYEHCWRWIPGSISQQRAIREYSTWSDAQVDSVPECENIIADKFEQMSVPGFPVDLWVIGEPRWVSAAFPLLKKVTREGICEWTDTSYYWERRTLLFIVRPGEHSSLGGPRWCRDSSQWVCATLDKLSRGLIIAPAYRFQAFILVLPGQRRNRNHFGMAVSHTWFAFQMSPHFVKLMW